MYPLARVLLFALDAEAAHRLTLFSLRVAQRLGLLKLLAAPEAPEPFELMGLVFANRIGLAAGFDKNATCVDAMGALGFGFLEVGTLTPEAQAGNPRPRVFRLPKARAVINAMGFPNAGVAADIDGHIVGAFIDRLQRRYVVGRGLRERCCGVLADVHTAHAAVAASP